MPSFAGSNFSTVTFYGQTKFGCNAVRFPANLRERLTSETPSASNGMQHHEKVCKRCFFN
jgi:hypothetical protein